MSVRSATAGALVLALLSGCASGRRAADRPAAAAPGLAPREAVVAQGETACGLAGRLGVDVAALRAANRLSAPPERPLAADRIAVPQAALRHRIRPGETLQGLAQWYGHPVAALAARNRIADPNRINAGIWLSIPAGARTGCAPAAPVVAKARPTAVAQPRPPTAPRAAAPARVRPPRPEPPPAAPAAPPAPETTAALARADAALDEASRRYDAADFEAVLALSEEARRAVGDGDDAARVERRARAHWLAGLANAGLDRREEARAALREALALRPSLRREQSLSPRILGLLEDASGEDP